MTCERGLPSPKQTKPVAEGTRFSRHYAVTTVPRGSAENLLDSDSACCAFSNTIWETRTPLPQTESYMSARKALTQSRAFCFLWLVSQDLSIWKRDSREGIVKGQQGWGCLARKGDPGQEVTKRPERQGLPP